MDDTTCIPRFRLPSQSTTAKSSRGPQCSAAARLGTAGSALPFGFFTRSGWPVGFLEGGSAAWAAVPAKAAAPAVAANFIIVRLLTLFIDVSFRARRGDPYGGSS